MNLHCFYLGVDFLHEYRSDSVFSGGQFRVETECIEEEAYLTVSNGGLALFFGALKCFQQLSRNDSAFIVAMKGGDLVVSVDEVSDIVFRWLSVLDQPVVALHQHFLELINSTRSETLVLDVAQH